MGPPRVEQTCAGGVVVRPQPPGVEVCVVFRTRRGQPTWGLPKGHVEAGESLAEAALREVREETGLRGRILQPLGSLCYRFTLPDDPHAYEKTIHVFLMCSTGGSLDAHDAEVVEARWWSLDQAMERLTYENERDVLRAASQALARPDIQKALSDHSAA